MAQTSGTIGITQALNETAKTVGNRELHTLDHLTVVLVNGEKAELKTAKKAVYLNNVAYTTEGDIYRKSVDNSVFPGYQDNQYVGFQIKIESGYSLSISSLYARLMVADNTYTWKVKIIDVAKGTTLFESDDKTTKKESSAVLNQTMTFSGLTGEIQVLLYMHQKGTTKYFVADNFTVQGTVQEDARPTKTITTSVDANGGGTVSPSGEFSCIEGESAKIEAVANTGYTFVSWLIDDKETVTTNPYTFENVTENHTAVAQFEALPKVTFGKGTDKDVKGVGNALVYVERGAEYTLPQAWYLVKDGYTFSAWTDGVNNYAAGSKITVSGDVELTPVFTPNEVSLGDEAVTVKWAFAAKNGAPALSEQYGNGTTPYYVQRVTLLTKTLDVPMQIVTTSSEGKINNVGRTDDAQVNGGTQFIIPAVKGMVVKYVGTNGTPTVESATFNGENADEVSKKTLSYTYNGDETTLTIRDGGSNMYPSGIEVTYPYVPKSYTLTTEDDDFYTLYLDYAVTVPENITVYTGALNGSTLTLNEVTDGYIKAGNAVIVKGTAAGTYTFTENKEVEAGTYEGNALKGVTVETAVEDLAAAGTVLTLGTDSEGTVGFRKPNNDKVSANKAYLDYVAPAAGAPAFVNILLPGEATGIQGIQSVQQKSADSAIYNMMGQRVGANAKGLILMNGKKVIRK